MFLSTPIEDERVRALYGSDKKGEGYVMNLTRLWAWRPELMQAFVELRKNLMKQTTLTQRELAVLVCCTARTLRDSYCSLAWGKRLSDASDPEIAAALLSSGDASSLSEREAALARWAEHVVNDPNAISRIDVDTLRSVGLSEQEIFDATLFISLRLAFSTVNDALGAEPDAELVAKTPLQVRHAVNYGRPASASS